jgi:hypothetical protein
MAEASSLHGMPAEKNSAGQMLEEELWQKAQSSIVDIDPCK